MVPFLVPLSDGIEIRSLLSAGEGEPMVGGYFLTGGTEGLGAYDSGSETFTVLVSHEIPFTPDIPFLFTNPQPFHKHGGRGAHVAKWVINKPNHTTDPWKVVSGEDLIQSVQIWKNGSYRASDEENFQVFCSCTLPPTTAYQNPATGLGTDVRILTTGEEFAPVVVDNPIPFLPPLFDRGDGGRPFAILVDGANAGQAWELPRLGNMLFENIVPSPMAQDKTIAILTDDEGPGQVYLYIGTKTAEGSEIDKAGLTNGKLYGIVVTGKPDEMLSGVQSGDAFTLADLGDVSEVDHDEVEAMSVAANVTFFAKPEDSHWDTQNANRFYVATSGARLDSVVYPSRLWRFTLNDILNPEQGGSLEIVLEQWRDSDIQKLDNIAVDSAGNVFLQEDESGTARRGKVWRYRAISGQVEDIAEHNPMFFNRGGGQFLSNHEESAGIIDVGHILGPGWLLTASQAHVEGDDALERFDNFVFDPAYYEEAQVMAMFIPSGDLGTLPDDLGLSITRVGNEVSASFETVVGSSYQGQRSSDLNNWADEGGEIQGDGTRQSVSLGAGTEGYLRISVVTRER